MPYALRSLARNLVAGLSLALFAPVDRLRFRIDPLQLLLVVLVSALVDVGADWLRYGPDVQLSLAGVGSELASAALLLLIGALLASWSRQRDLVLALPIVVLAAFVPVQLVDTARDLASARYGGALAQRAAETAVTAWIVALLIRAAWVAHVPIAARAARAIAGGLLLALPLFVPSGVWPAHPWWVAVGEATSPSAASEPVLAYQRKLQDDALAALDDHSPGVTDLYFVAFAPDGAAPWRERVEQAVKVMEEHWGADGRTLGYLNDAANPTRSPMATITHLREALSEIAAASDPDEDVLMLYLAGRSNPDGSMSVRLPPLDLVQLSAAGLRSLLDEAGFAWRIVVVASCDPGPFANALSDEQTVVMASAPLGGSVADCARRGEPVSLGDALFGDALPRAGSLRAAFDAAKAQLERPGAGTAPYLHVGSEIAGKLEAIQARSSNLIRARLSQAAPRRGRCARWRAVHSAPRARACVQ